MHTAHRGIHKYAPISHSQASIHIFPSHTHSGMHTHVTITHTGMHVPAPITCTHMDVCIYATHMQTCCIYMCVMHMCLSVYLHMVHSTLMCFWVNQSAFLCTYASKQHMHPRMHSIYMPLKKTHVLMHVPTTYHILQTHTHIHTGLTESHRPYAHFLL